MKPRPPTITLARFNRLSKRAQRVAIAKDVLARLATKQLTPVSGAFVLIDPDKAKVRSLQVYVNEGQKCEVCALGAAMCAVAGVANKINLNTDGDTFGYRVDFTSSGAYARLKRSFSPHSLVAMELAFEDGEGAYAYSAEERCFNTYAGTTPEMAARIKAFVAKHPNQRKRLGAIYRNVAKHGDFTP